jgi:hypothetical protein
MFVSLLAVIGYGVFLGKLRVSIWFVYLVSNRDILNGTHSNAVRYGSLFLSLPGIYCTAPAMSTWNANNVAPATRRATAVAIAFIMTNSGGILATWLLGSLSPAPKYTKATITFVIFSVGMFLFNGFNLVYLWWQNQKKTQKRIGMVKEDESSGLGDGSSWFIYNL